MRLVASLTSSTASPGSVITITVDSEGACVGAAALGGATGCLVSDVGLVGEGSAWSEFARLAAPPRTTASTPMVAAATAAPKATIATTRRDRIGSLAAE